MTATLVLSDDNGAVALQLGFSGGFQDDSRAHQAALMLVRFMDEHCARQGQPNVVATQGQPSTGGVWTGGTSDRPANDGQATSAG